MLTKKQLEQVAARNLENIVRKAAGGKTLTQKEMETLRDHAGVLDSADAEQMTADKFCQITGLTDRRHRQIAKAGFFPMPKKGIYQLTPALAGFMRFLREQVESAAGGFNDERLKKLTAERHMAELKLAKERKAALDAGAVFRAWENIVLTIRQKLMALPSKCAPRLAHLGEQTTIEAELDREVADALADLAKVQNYEDSTEEIQAGDGGSGGANETAAQD
jgi:phage terminase Nu1 subunit (DNA packaging protein)